MKKIISLVLLSVLLLSFAACGKKTDEKESTGETKVPTSVATEAPTEKPAEVWYQIPDMDVVGTYQRVDDKNDTAYYIFSSENTLRYRNGCTTFEFDIEYGLSAEGNRIGRCDGPVLYGNWTYGFEDDCLLIVYQSGDQFKFSPVRYTPVELKAYEDFEKNEELVGEWKSVDDETIRYTFTDDGYCNYSYEIKAQDDQPYNYNATSDFIYSVGYNTITLETYVSDTELESIDLDYSISDGKLTIDGFTFERVTE